MVFFFFQAEDGIRDRNVTGVQTCALPISASCNSLSIDARRWPTIERELQEAEPPKLDKPAGGLLLHYDEQEGEYNPLATAAFLFVTREGATDRKSVV